MISLLFPILAEAAVPPAGPAGLFSNPVVPFVLIGIIFYFLIIRPQSKRQKDLEKLLTSLKTGDKVVTASGIHGIISNVKEGKTLILKIADNVKIEIDKSAISAVEKSAETSTPAVSAS
jgi:preprotein translocase subunit YajC